jgi:hypothetical protein
MKRPADCLDLCGDGDDVDVIVAIEKAFGVRSGSGA